MPRIVALVPFQHGSTKCEAGKVYHCADAADAEWCVTAGWADLAEDGTPCDGEMEPVLQLASKRSQTMAVGVVFHPPTTNT